MTRRYKVFVGMLSSVMLGCSSAAPPDPVAVITNSCPPSPSPKRTVVGCGLAPQVALLGVDEQALYVVTGNRTFFQVARDTGQPTKLYHNILGFNPTPGEATSQLINTSFQDGKIYLLDYFIEDRHGYHAIMSMDARTPGSPSLVILVGQEPVFVFADDYAYFQDRLTQSGVPAPLTRAPLGGGASQVVYAGEGVPIAVHGGYVYFVTNDSAIHRAPVAGGADNLILPKLPRWSGAPSVSYLDLAVDDDYLYVPVPSLGGGAPHTLQRFAVTGGDSGTVIASISTTFEVLLGPPRKLRVDGDYVYFILANGLNRVKRGGDGNLETLSSTMAPPSFDATSIYVTEQLGGQDSPLQSIIVRIPK